MGGMRFGYHYDKMTGKKDLFESAVYHNISKAETSTSDMGNHERGKAPLAKVDMKIGGCKHSNGRGHVF